MNERIKQLILKAGFHPFVRGEQILFDISTEENLKEFAESIIRECIKAASDPGDELIKDDTWHDGVRACVWSIQDEFNLDRTFGVEE